MYLENLKRKPTVIIIMFSFIGAIFAYLAFVRCSLFWLIVFIFMVLCATILVRQVRRAKNDGAGAKKIFYVRAGTFVRARGWKDAFTRVFDFFTVLPGLVFDFFYWGIERLRLYRAQFADLNAFVSYLLVCLLGMEFVRGARLAILGIPRCNVFLCSTVGMVCPDVIFEEVLRLVSINFSNKIKI